MIGTGDDPPFSVAAYQGALEYSKKALAQYRHMNLTSYGGG